jgi:hypothetical protein
MQRRMKLIDTLAQRTRKSLESIDWNLVHNFTPDMLLWILMAGNLAAGNGIEKEWYLRKIKSLATSPQVPLDKEISRRVREFLWLDSFVSRECIWQDGTDPLKLDRLSIAED